MTLTESEFLKRELNLILAEIDSETGSNLIQQPVFAIATLDPEELAKILSKCKTNSAIVFFFGNETYDVPQTMALNRYSHKIKFAYIYNFPRRTSFYTAFRCLIGAIFDGGLKYWEKDQNIYRNFKNGIDLMRRTRKLNLLFEHSDFPQGYSKRFIEELIAEKYHSGDGSVVDRSPINVGQKIKNIAFVGQEGSWCRTLALSVLRNFDKTFLPTYTIGWGGSNQGGNNTYIKELAISKFALNPPGNLTNRTHRYLESLIMNSLPVLPPSNLQDPHLWGVWSENQTPRKYSWKMNLKKSYKLGENQRQNLINSALKVEKEKINSINSNLDNLFFDSLKDC